MATFNPKVEISIKDLPEVRADAISEDGQHLHVSK